MAEPTVEELKAQIAELEAQVAALQSGGNLEDIGIQLALNYISWADSIYGADENEQRDILREDYAYTEAEIDTIFSVRAQVLASSYFKKPATLRRRKYTDGEIDAMSLADLNKIIKRRGYECTGENATEIKASFKTVQAADPLLDPR